MTQTKPKNDVYSIVTQHIVSSLEMACIPWRESWVSAGIPRNAITQKPYRGINVPLLARHCYDYNLFLTEAQIANLKGAVKKDEPARIATYWEWRDSTNGSTEKYPVLKYERVYNIAQCEGIAIEPRDETEKADNPLLVCKNIVNAMQNAPKREAVKEAAYYGTVEDCIHIPPSSEYTKPEYYYFALFQLLVHSTAHPGRLNRKDAETYEQPFSTEALIVDMAAHYLCFYAGLTGLFTVPNTKYIYGWMERFTEDPKLVVYAAGQAQKAVEYILNVNIGQENSGEAVQSGSEG